MKEVRKIKLHSLSQAEMAEKEMNLLKGGYDVNICVSICMDAVCKCLEDSNGNFPISEGTIETYMTTNMTERGYSELSVKSPSGGEIQSTGILT